jgi:hypothetical protein
MRESQAGMSVGWALTWWERVVKRVWGVGGSLRGVVVGDGEGEREGEERSESESVSESGLGAEGLALPWMER